VTKGSYNKEMITMRKAAYFCIAMICVFAMVGMASAATSNSPALLQVRGRATTNGSYTGTPVVGAPIIIYCSVEPGPNVTLTRINTDIMGDYYWWGSQYIPGGNNVQLAIMGINGMNVDAVVNVFGMPNVDPTLFGNQPPTITNPPNAGWTFDTIIGFPCILNVRPYTLNL
jgi:hypothetical protein